MLVYEWLANKALKSIQSHGTKDELIKALNLAKEIIENSNADYPIPHDNPHKEQGE